MTKSYRPMMKFSETQNDGSQYAGNALRFATEHEAEASASDLMNRWFVPIGWRVDVSDDAPNYRWDETTQKIIAIGETEIVQPV